MAENTKIEWATHTFNPWIGCTKVSPGCGQCYAERLAQRFPDWPNWGPGVTRMLTSDTNWKLPLKWNRRAGLRGVRERVFCASLSDVFDKEVDPLWRERLWRLIACTENLDWLLLTKRPRNIQSMLPEFWPLQNVWLGVSAENHDFYDDRFRALCEVTPRPAVRFVSAEPLLNWIWPGTVLAPSPDWVIIGGESGPASKIRPMKPAWARALLDSCHERGVPVWFKQWGDYRNNPLAAALGSYTLGTTPSLQAQARELDPDGKGGSLIYQKHFHELPTPRKVLP